MPPDSPRLKKPIVGKWEGYHHIVSRAFIPMPEVNEMHFQLMGTSIWFIVCIRSVSTSLGVFFDQPNELAFQWGTLFYCILLLIRITVDMAECVFCQ